MRIARHRLHGDSREAFDFSPSPNRGAALQPEYLVMHYTAGGSLQESVDWLGRRESKASAHVVIGRDGKIVQQVPFDVVAWHAGASSWEGRVGMNRYSIGIELDNAGRLMRHGSRWRAWFGGSFKDEDVIEATHKNESAPSGWHTFPPVQLQAALDLAVLLVDRYKLQDVLGHDDISPGRKADPGPAFPMESFRSRIFGRREDDIPEYRAMAALNIRTGPGTRHATLSGSPLPPGTRMQVIRAQDSWRLVDVLDDVGGITDMQGWVHSRFLATAPAQATTPPNPAKAPGGALEASIQ